MTQRIMSRRQRCSHGRVGGYSDWLQKGLSVGGKYVATDGWRDTVIDC